MMKNVMKSLEAVASGIGKQDEDTFVSFYNFAKSQLETDEEKEALRLGTLAMVAGACKLRFRHIYYTYLFRKAMKKLPR